MLELEIKELVRLQKGDFGMFCLKVLKKSNYLFNYNFDICFLTDVTVNKMVLCVRAYQQFNNLIFLVAIDLNELVLASMDIFEVHERKVDVGSCVIF